MTIPTHCFMCGRKLEDNSGGTTYSSILSCFCGNRLSGPSKLTFYIYKPDSNYFEYVVDLPSGIRLNASNRNNVTILNIYKTIKGERKFIGRHEINNFYLEFKEDIDYLEQKCKTLLTFG